MAVITTRAGVNKNVYLSGSLFIILFKKKAQIMNKYTTKFHKKKELRKELNYL